MRDQLRQALIDGNADFVVAVRQHDAMSVGLSALLTTTLPHMAETIAALKEAGLREQVKVMVGGAPVTAAWAEEIGADGYGRTAADAVDLALAHVEATAGVEAGR